MKKNLFRIYHFVLTLVILVSCGGNENSTQNEANTSNNPVTLITSDSYDPGREYALVWADEFDGEELNMDNWNYQVEPAGRFNDEWQRYTNDSKNAYVENGNLIIQAVHEGEDHGMDQYTSARMNTANKQAWKYGKIVASIKLPQGKGIWPAFWMLGANINENGGDTPWPQCGEIDILELYGSKDDGVVEANIHYADATNNHAMLGAKSYELPEGKFADAYHVFELVWDEKEVVWLVDGTDYASFSIAKDELSEFHKEFFILLNIAVGGNYAGRPDDSTIFPQKMYVDWVRVYQKST